MLIIPIGVNELEEQIYVNLTDSNLLICGRIGSRKTTLTKLLIGNTNKYKKSELLITIIDTKGVEYLNYKNSNIKVQSDMSELDREIFNLKDDLKERKNILKKAKCSSIDKYNAKAENKIPVRLIVLENMHLYTYSTEYKDFLNDIATISTIGRTYGIHFIFVSNTQKLPSNLMGNVGSMLLIGNEIPFKSYKNPFDSSEDINNIGFYLIDGKGEFFLIDGSSPNYIGVGE